MNFLLTSALIIGALSVVAGLMAAREAWGRYAPTPWGSRGYLGRLRTAAARRAFAQALLTGALLWGAVVTLASPVWLF